jgi:uncharacterized membrane-anchored protein YitT (DUF2179 family)
MQILTAFLLAGLIMGLFASIVASEKGYSGGVWFTLGFFFSLIALFASMGLPDKKLRPQVK